MIRRILLHQILFSPITGYHFMMMEPFAYTRCMLLAGGRNENQGYWKSYRKNLKSKTKLISATMSRRIFSWKEREAWYWTGKIRLPMHVFLHVRIRKC